MIPERIAHTLDMALHYMDLADGKNKRQEIIAEARAWLAAQPAAEWRPMEDGFQIECGDAIVRAYDSGELLASSWDSGIEVELPDHIRLCERVLAAAEAT